jgi:hypothetical protein
VLDDPSPSQFIKIIQHLPMADLSILFSCAKLARVLIYQNLPHIGRTVSQWPMGGDSVRQNESAHNS